MPETLGYNNELKNRFIHVDYKEKSEIHSAIEEDSKCNNCTLEELAILRELKKNPSITQKELAVIIGKSERTIKIETERLLLHPISDEEMQKAYSEMLQGCLDNPEDRVWFATWNMELKEQLKTIVGDLCFKGITDDGMVEIGYGLKKGDVRTGIYYQILLSSAVQSGYYNRCKGCEEKSEKGTA